jgi:interferon gamma-inducible protein 30
LAFIRTSLKTAANTKDFWKICEFNFYPYGNARRTQNGSSWAFTCQHGAKECQGNLIEACATRKFDFYSQGLPFSICLEDNTTDFIAQGKKCASQYSMDWNVIDACVNGPEGNKLMYDISVATDRLNPAHTYVPWVVVNDKHTTTSENAILKNMVQYVCSIYTGPEKIAACK